MNHLTCILCSSVTYAYKGRDLLSRMGIWSRVEKPAASLGDQGCSYCLTLDSRNAELAVQAFQEYGVRFQSRWRCDR